jgi:aminopeptidase N
MIRARLAGALAAAICGASAAGPASAQTAAPYRPGFHVRNYDIAIDVPDSGATIHADATLTVERTAARDTLVLDLLDLRVVRVAVNGRGAAFRQTPEAVVVVLPNARVGDTTMVEVEYGGAVTDGLIARRDSAGRWTYFGDNWPNRARHWIPSLDHPSDKATVTWRVRASPMQGVVANGAFVSTRQLSDPRDGPRTEWVWRESRPIPVYLMVIAAAPLARYDLGETACNLGGGDDKGCVPQYVYTAPEQAKTMPGPFARAGDIVALFSRLVGPFPYEKLAHLQSSTRYGGMENASEIFYSDAAFRRGTMNDELIAHETAHQWFGDAVTERQWPHVWLSEGFATYFSALWVHEARGDSAFRTRMRAIRSTVLRDSVSVWRRPVIDTIETTLMQLLNRNSYEKGGFVLHMLRTQVGDSAFFRALRAYYAAHRNSTALTADLQSAMETASGQKLDWFFDQWLRRPGYPEIDARWRYDAQTREAVIDVRQSSRFGTYRVPLLIKVVDSLGGEHRATLPLPADTGLHSIRIGSPTKPSAVLLDPNVTLLASMRVVPPSLQR